MKKFHAERKLQQASLTYIVNNLLSKEEALSRKIFGEGNKHPFVEETLGDYIAISLDEYTFLYHYNEEETLMMAHHAGGTKEETQLYMYLIKFAR